MRAGDHVLHGPSGETWVVAYVDGDYIAWCGWPAGEAKVSDCTLVKPCSDEEHLELLHKLAKSDGKRASQAKVALAKRGNPDNDSIGATIPVRDAEPVTHVSKGHASVVGRTGGATPPTGASSTKERASRPHKGKS